MLLAIDIGNTNAACGLFEEARLVKRWRLPRASLRTAEAIRAALTAGLGKRRLPRVRGVCIASVVPELDARFRAACRRTFGIEPLFATHETAGMRIESYDRRQVGADRLVAALAGFSRARRATIIVDAGTAITIDLVTARGAFAGGVIVPGMGTQAAALYAVAAKLPLVRVRPTRRVRGRTTEDAIRGGIFHGTAGLVDAIVGKIAREARVRPRVIATGGDAPALSRACTCIDEVRPDLVLEGLRLVWEKNRKA